MGDLTLEPALTPQDLIQRKWCPHTMGGLDSKVTIAKSCTGFQNPDLVAGLSPEAGPVLLPDIHCELPSQTGRGQKCSPGQSKVSREIAFVLGL